MKRNETQHGAGTDKSKAPALNAQELNALRLRALQAKGGFLALGTDSYIPFVESQARREGLVLSAEDKMEIRQVANGRVFSQDVPWVELLERALHFQQAA